MLTEYKTLLQNGIHEIDVKGSRFICHLHRVKNEDEAVQFIQSIQKQHWKATHNCSAFLIGERHEIQRASDDGEPSGTAGVPMLEVLKKNDLHDVVAVVTRYFGGTKLGAGGLIRAYTQAVADALSHLGIAICRLESEVALTVSYALAGKLEYYLAQENITIKDKIYEEHVTFICSIPIDAVESQRLALIELLNNQVTFTIRGDTFVESPYHPV